MSDEDRAIELWLRMTGGERLSEADRRDLLGALEENPRLRARLLRNDQIDGLLQSLGLSEAESRVFEEAFVERLAAEGDATRFIEKVESGLDRSVPAGAGDARRAMRPSTRRSIRAHLGSGERRALVPALLAGGALIGLLLVLAILPSRPPRPGPRKAGAALPGARGAEPAGAQAGPEAALPDEARREGEKRLAELKERERHAGEAKRRAERSPDQDLRRKAEEVFQEIARKRKEEEARQSKLREEEERRGEDARRTAEKPAPPSPPEKPPSDPAPTAPRTEAAVAQLERADAQTFILAREGRVAAKAGQPILAGQGLETAAETGAAAMVYGDKTRLELQGLAEIRDVLEREAPAKGARGKRVLVKRGTVLAEIARQPQDQPMVFLTPHAQVTVVGTSLKITVSLDERIGTRLEVGEGKVRLADLAGKTVEVASGHYAVAAVGAELASRPLPVEDIVLLPPQAAFVGTEWKVQIDPLALKGLALENLKTRTPDRPTLAGVPYAAFAFKADADRDYSVWIRGHTTATQARQGCDSVIVEIPEGRFTRPPTGWPLVDATFERAFFDGYAASPGYTWLGGVLGLQGGAGTWASVRFARSGPQTLRIYSYEAPLRIDAIWISSRQKERPHDNQIPPGMDRK